MVLHDIPFCEYPVLSEKYVPKDFCTFLSTRTYLLLVHALLKNWDVRPQVYAVKQGGAICGPRRENCGLGWRGYHLQLGITDLQKKRYASHVKFGEFGTNVALKVLISEKKRSTAPIYINIAASRCFEAYLCFDTLWITNSDWSAKFSISLKLVHLRKGCTSLL